jgi:hypothetical protein|nr:MAG TPA: ASCH domain protein [Caudoviricetes sp.]
MAIKPILFNTEMVRAILDGRKTCTRRLVRFLPGENPQWTGYIRDGLMLYNGKNEPCIRKAPYQPGDTLYVRETWKKAPNGYYYYEDWQRGDIADLTKWKPSIHMPKEAARIWIKIMNVRVERLQEMKPVDVIKEGAYSDCWDCLNTYGESGSQCCYGTEEQCSQCDEVMMEWEKLWTSTIKKSNLNRYGWDANPWVWVIEFERCEKPEA